ncbi:hypothetical protein LTR37_009226 [Vermiconidia calcicola]|uniref:Uncharacterized protein n=1 Tax=Vermiconidia calcicola TaxID=1690605 RepID=A0ACC3NB83_9PEZI|nr:hypothetical protein LTR37_009226 [Vermiconidia calcicola]
MSKAWVKKCLVGRCDPKKDIVIPYLKQCCTKHCHEQSRKAAEKYPKEKDLPGMDRGSAAMQVWAKKHAACKFDEQGNGIK